VPRFPFPNRSHAVASFYTALFLNGMTPLKGKWSAPVVSPIRRLPRSPSTSAHSLIFLKTVLLRAASFQRRQQCRGQVDGFAIRLHNCHQGKLIVDVGLAVALRL